MAGYVGFVLDKVTLGQDFSKYFSFLCTHSRDCSTLIIIRHPGVIK
jgi:hypothetical protein